MDSNDLENLTKEQLMKKVSLLEEELRMVKEKTMGDYIDNYVDEWFEKNKKDVDIGVIDIGGICKVDLLPDSIEKHIYKKTFKILVSLVLSLSR